jgi:hypothetical protein
MREAGVPAADEDAPYSLSVRGLSDPPRPAHARGLVAPGIAFPHALQMRVTTISRVAGGKTIAWPLAASTSRPAKASCGFPPGMCSCACRLLM